MYASIISSNTLSVLFLLFSRKELCLKKTLIVHVCESTRENLEPRGIFSYITTTATTKPKNKALSFPLPLKQLLFHYVADCNQHSEFQSVLLKVSLVCKAQGAKANKNDC